MTEETILPELVGTLASLPEHTQKTIKAYGAACYRTALQSPEIQALKRDAERLDWLADPNNSIGNVQLPTVCVERNPHSLRDAIEDAMEQQA